MRFEKLNYNSGSKNRIFLYGLIMGVLLIVVMNLFLTKAKYRLTESIPIARGTITTTGYDFKIMALYELEDNGQEKALETVPSGSEYIINKAKSYCTNDNKEKVYGKLETINGKHTFSDLKKNDKCYVWFMKDTLANETLNKLNQIVKGTPTFTGTSCEGNCTLKENGLYYGEDDFGDSYVYRGSVDNNWVVFGQDTKNSSEYIWWRIIRINGNGTLRLIYAGTSSNTTQAPETTGETTMINPTTNAGNKDYPRAVRFNETYNDNKYVGYMYPGQKGEASTTFDGAHKVDISSTNSTILEQIKLWYEEDTNLEDLSEKIDVDTGFCSDTNLATGNHESYTGSGYGQQQSAYAGTDRVWQTGSISVLNPQTPTFKCGYTVSTSSTDKNARKRDLYTGPNANPGGIKGNNNETVEGNNALPVPVGLITMDEAIYAGGFLGKTNNRYWLYTNQSYWTMTPYNFNGSNTHVFLVNNDGNLTGYGGIMSTIHGARPVINLKSTVTFEPGGNGTSTNPYIVQTS